MERSLAVVDSVLNGLRGLFGSAAFWKNVPANAR
jgi:hypothetical protein